MKNLGIDEYNINLERKCKYCNHIYTIEQYLSSDIGIGLEDYFLKPLNYIQGCERYCLSCWLDTPIDDLETNNESTTEINLPFINQHTYWYDTNKYKEILAGDLPVAYKDYINDGCHLAILPLSRLHIDRTLLLPCGVAIYPAGVLKLDELNFRNESDSLPAKQSKASGINIKILNKHPLVVLPFKYDWEDIFKCSHEQHLNIIRGLSELIDRHCLNFIRYKNCELEPIPSENLPSHAGQVSTNHMMSAALLFNSQLNQAKLIAGAAFSHYITRGLGLVLTQPEWDKFPQGGDVAEIVNHALLLYANLLETQTATSRFVQALSLLEYLAHPYEYKSFKNFVKKIIARYQTNNPTEYKKLLDRFEELTGKKNEYGEEIGFRTRIVHIGDTIEKIVPNEIKRKELFNELEGYIKNVIDHMIEHSDLSFADYIKERDKLARYDGLRNEAP